MPVLPTAPPQQSTRDITLTDLNTIGVPDDQQVQWPQVVAYPSRFSDEAFPVWEEVLEDPVFSKRIHLTSRDLAWNSVILEFLSRCSDRGINPVPGGAQTGPNAFVKDGARRGRIFVVDYCDEIGLFEKLQVRYAYREYIRTEDQITFYSWATMFPISDPTFDKWLTSLPMPRFMRHNRSRLVATIRPNVRLWVNCINLYRVVVGMEIDVKGHVEIPGNPVPTRQEVDDYIDRLIWMPLVRSIRFDLVTNRLF